MQLELINKKMRLSDVILQSQSLSSIPNEWIAAQHIMEAATYWEMIWLGSNNCAGCLLVSSILCSGETVRFLSV
jgi:Ni,Fe-hydrogenase I small subunit